MKRKNINHERSEFRARSLDGSRISLAQSVQKLFRSLSSNKIAREQDEKRAIVKRFFRTVMDVDAEKQRERRQNYCKMHLSRRSTIVSAFSS